MDSIKRLITPFLFIFLLINENAFAQQNTIKGTIYGYENKPVFLAEVFGHQQNIIDTTLTNTEGEFAFQLSEKNDTGIYKLLFKSDYSKQIMQERPLNILFSHQNIVFETSLDQMYNDLDFEQSPLNKAYYEFLLKYKNLMGSFGSMRNKLQYYQNDEENLSKIAKSINDIGDKITTYIDTLAQNEENDFLSTLYLTYQIPEFNAHWTREKSMRHLRANFLKPFPFNEPRIIHSSRIPSKINEYLQFYKDPRLIKRDQDSLLIRGAERILLHAFINDKVYEYVLSYLTHFFEKQKRQRVLEFLAKESEKNKCHSTNDEVHKTLQKYLQLGLGKKVPDIEFRDPFTEKQHSLHDIDAEYTLVIFWATFCGHCTEKMPEYKKLYETTDRSLFEMVAISVDDKREIYLDYVVDKGYDKWINYADFKGWQSEFAKMFNVKYTPNTFLLNKDKEIIGKPNYIELRDILNNNQ